MKLHIALIVGMLAVASNAAAKDKDAKSSEAEKKTIATVKKLGANPKPLTVAIAVPARGRGILRPIPPNTPASIPAQKGKLRPRYIDFRSKQSHFHVVVTNTSGKPQRLWETWNSWGYYNLRFEVADQKGKVLFVIKKKPRNWTVNFPSWLELESGEHFVMEVYFDKEKWNVPFLNKNSKGKVQQLRMRAIFEIKSDRTGFIDAEKYKIWTGKISSPFKEYHVYHLR